MPSFVRLFVPLMIIAGAASVTGCAAEPNQTNQTGTGDDAQQSELRRSRRSETRSDADVRADVERAAQGAVYVSETDSEYKWVGASLDGERAITEALVREKLGHYVDQTDDGDGPLADQFGMEESFSKFSDLGECSEGEYPGPEECAKTRVLLAALKSNLTNLKVFYFGRDGSPGHVNGVAVTIFVVGITPAGNLGGVQTLAVWT
jgi:hypothetical protein